MSGKTLRVADVLARRLYAAGVRYAFGMPGGEVLTIVDALEAAGIQFVLAKHENAAGFMAEGVYHRTGAPGVLVATVGPGALNGINVVANALQDRVPMVVITGCVDAVEAETFTHQVLDQQAVFRPVTKASFRMAADAAGVIADKAVATASSPRPGPVHIDLPVSVADARVADVAQPVRAAAAAVVPVGDVWAQTCDWLAAAERPVMVVGVDAMNADAGDAVRGFAERFGVPVVTTYKAKGLLAEDHPLAVGGAGLSPLADGVLLPVLREADLIICAGYDPIEMRIGWRDVWDVAVQRVIDISAVENTHYMHQGGLNIVASVDATLDALTRAVSPRDGWGGRKAAEVRADLAAAFPVGDVWGPAAVIDECRQVLPPETLATVDSGAHRILLSQMWMCHGPRGLMQSSGLCTMGCAVPLAMGAGVASPGVPVVSFAGDAGFLMVAGELATAAELGLKTIFVVFVDASLALIELKQRQRQMANRGVDFGHHDFAAIGRAFGGAGVTVRSREALRDALETALEAESFTVIAAEIDRNSYDGRI